MTTYSKLNVVYRLQKWMDSVPGQTFLNYAYSWGASIVILGTLFKLTHLAGADFYVHPSLKETAALMPRHAARYGTIPILNLTTGLKDDFDKDNCIPLDLSNLENGIDQACALFKNKREFNEKRKFIMNYDFSWKSRIGQWVEFYETFSNHSRWE